MKYITIKLTEDQIRTICNSLYNDFEELYSDADMIGRPLDIRNLNKEHNVEARARNSFKQRIIDKMQLS